jgi:lipoic acid synthetase
MIMGEICSRNCPFCNVTHGTPTAPSSAEPKHLAGVISALSLNYVVITSVTRDDLNDGGAGHFVRCIEQIRLENPSIKIEILVPDFRRDIGAAVQILGGNLPDVFNHNLETVHRLYAEARPGADYHGSLNLLQKFQSCYPDIPTKSGLMVGLGESDDEILKTMNDLLIHNCKMLTIGQYLRPSRWHLPIRRYVNPEQFELYRVQGLKMGFSHVESGPLVRSSYHADVQAGQFLEG